MGRHLRATLEQPCGQGAHLDPVLAPERKNGGTNHLAPPPREEGGYDLIVVGHSDHSELWGRMLGDTADRMADHAHCSVLIVKP